MSSKEGDSVGTSCRRPWPSNHENGEGEGVKDSLAVPVVASYAIINGEEGGEGDRKATAPSRELFHGHSAAMSGEETLPPEGVPQMHFKQEPNLENLPAEQRSRNEKSYECKVCARNFETAARLKSHRAANACHAPYACRLCSREFHRANELAEHAEAAHADPRMCVLCGRLLSRKDKLENHVRTHTGEQPFECKFCLKRFSRRDRFNEHEKLHRGISFKCGECQKCFSRRDKMKEHFQRSHHDRSEDCEWYGGTLR
ncbi:zinc finger protein 25-like isoform X2 [Hetaerina americana]|uniref:zinc finger protein 25-like isoform X2 n=1 Tax=Hetaerina americana TaxID=62018 RepID=UPI003A7F5CB2